MLKTNKKIVNASELGRYAYCPRKFLLEQRLGWNKGELSRMKIGTEYHRQVQGGVSFGRLMGVAFFILAGVFLVGLVLIWLR